MRAILDVLRIVLDLYMWVVIIHVILSWLLHFRVVNAHNVVVATLWQLTQSLIDPILSRLRPLLPRMGGLDLAPLALILLLILTERVIIYYIYPNVP